MLSPGHTPPPGKRAGHRPTGWLFSALLCACVLLLATGCLVSAAVPTLVAVLASGAGTPSPADGATQPATGASQPAATSMPAWSGTQRLTILLMGMDGPSNTPNHTDSMMLVSV